MKPDRTHPRVESLTASQVKALLVVASASGGKPAASPRRRAAGGERRLARMAGARHGGKADLLETTTAATTPVEDLIRTKDLAKTLIKAAADSRQREAATVLYHAAVASAFVHHATAISSRPMARQQGLYEGLAASWADHAIGRLFREAAARLASEPRP